MDDAATVPEAIEENPTNRAGDGAETSDGQATLHDGADDQAATFEVIDGIEVHPAASVMPAMPVDQFTKLVESIAECGLGEPIEFKDDKLVEGRHRLRAIVLLRGRGTVIEVRKAPWQPFPDETVAEYVKRKNLDRRHITDDQRLLCAAELMVMADRERAAAGYTAGRIQKGEKRNPKGCNQFKKTQGEEDGSPIPTTSSTPGVKGKSKKMRSCHEQLSASERASLYKARQALKIAKLGTPRRKAVKEGDKKPAEVAKAIEERETKKSTRKPRAKKPVDHPFKPQTPLQHDLVAGWVELRDAKVATPEIEEALMDMIAICEAELVEVRSRKKPAASKKEAKK